MIIKLIIIGVIVFAFSFWFVVHFTSKKKSRGEILAAYRRMGRRAYQYQPYQIQRERWDAERSQIEQIRNNVDNDRIQRGLRPVYGPNGIRAEMRNEGDGNGWIEDREDPRYVPEYLRVNITPKKGAVKIVSGKKFVYDGKRWNYVIDIHEKIDFITEEDMMI